MRLGNIKFDRYNRLTWECKPLVAIKKVVVVPITVGVLGVVSKNVQKNVGQLGARKNFAGFK